MFSLGLPPVRSQLETNPIWFPSGLILLENSYESRPKAPLLHRVVFVSCESEFVVVSYKKIS